MIQQNPAPGHHGLLRIAAVVVLGVGALQAVAGLAGAVTALAGVGGASLNLPAWVFLLQIVAFGGTAAALVLGERADARVQSLACVLTLVAASYARAATDPLEAALGHPGWLVLLRSIRVDAFLPAFAWAFFRDFPRGLPSRRVRSRANAMIALSGGIATGLLLANLVLPWWADPPRLLAAVDIRERDSLYWPLVYVPTLLALPFGVWRTRVAERDERRRASILATGITLAAAPVAAYVVAMGAWPAFARWYGEGGGKALIDALLQLLIVSIPLTTAYSVLVDRVLPVRLILRQALQYGLARVVVTVAAALPFIWIVSYLYPRRDTPLAELLGGTRSLALGAALVSGLGLVWVRGRARNAIDRAFFRERYDARRTLLSVVEHSRGLARTDDLADLLSGEIDRALGLESIGVLLATPAGPELRAVRSALRPLRADSPLAARLAEKAEPLGADLEGLPRDDRYWLADSGAELLVPLVSSAGDLIGLVVLGPRRSELPFSPEDRQLLAAIGAAGAVVLESRLKLGSGSEPARASEEAARGATVCERCSQVGPEPAGPCPGCGGRLRPIALPALLHGKFRLRRQVGQGSMGVVYRAVDEQLGRAVAIKTLPARTPEQADGLRREARAMATVLHPNLSILYAAETWMGTPLLVTEFLEGGTLEDRLESGPLSIPEVAELGRRICSALETLHRAGLLHRDVKPSNIGYTAEGTPKLLDFGLARFIGEARTRSLDAGALPTGATTRATLTNEGIVGTPLYMSPQAIRGEAPDASSDLWALAVVLYEAMTGRNPVERPAWSATHRAICEADVADIREDAPDAGDAVAGFFRAALHRDPAARPASAREFGDRWAAAMG